VSFCSFDRMAGLSPMVAYPWLGTERRAGAQLLINFS
jgi:hypothetical protein